MVLNTKAAWFPVKNSILLKIQKMHPESGLDFSPLFLDREIHDATRREKNPTTKSNAKARELLKEKGEGVLCVLSVQRGVLDRRLVRGCQGKGPNRAEESSPGRNPAAAPPFSWLGRDT